MKKIMIFGLILAAFSASAQNKAINSFYAKYKDKGCFTLDLSGNFLSGFLKSGDQDDELKEIVRHIDQFKMVNIPKEVQVFSAAAINDLKKSIRKDKFEDIFTMKDGESDISVMVKEVKGDVKEIIMLSSGEDGVFMLDISGAIPRDKVQKLMEDIEINQ